MSTAPNLPTNAEAQKRRVLNYLQTHNTGINRYEADTLLNICWLPSRISELKADGHIFNIYSESTADLSGRIHHGIARYFWIGQIQPQTPAANDQSYDVGGVE